MKNKLIKGVVQKIAVNAQYGLTSFSLKGQDGWYSLGKDKPTFNEGDSIQFETKTVGKYTYAKDIAPWTDGGTTQGESVARVANAAPNRSFGGKGRSFGGGASAAKDEYWANKEARDIAKEGEYAVTQKRIEIQAARNAAIETAKAMWQLDITPKPKAVKDHYDAFMALVSELVDKYIADTSSRLGVSQGRDEADRREPDASTERAVQGAGSATAANDPAWD